MVKKVKVTYNSETKHTDIIVNGTPFDTSRIAGKEIAEWAYPFLVKKIRWNGFYEEIKTFNDGDGNFAVQFDGSDKDLSVLKDALKDTAAKIAGLNNKVVILYKTEPLSTKITVNGKVFDTTRITNRSIDEWISPFQFKDVAWAGIFAELEEYLGTDEYSVQFVGKTEEMTELMNECPENVNITYRAPSASASPKIGGDFKANLSGVKDSIHMPDLSGVSGQMLDKMKQEVSDEEINQNLQNIPIKNEFIRQNAMAICAALSIIMAIFPFVKYTVESEYGGDQVTSLNGFTALFGANGTFVAALLFIAPILIIVMNYIKQLKPYRRIIAIAAPIGCIVFEIITAIMLRAGFMAASKAADAGNAALESMGMSANMETHFSLQIGFFLILLTYILTAIVGFMTYYGLELPKKSN